MTCRHERKVQFYPSDMVWWNTVSRTGGKHPTILVEGCLDCGRMWMRDYGE
jgi:hypothetical protein